MKYSEQPLQTFRLRNFKAVRDSGVVKFTPLTVFIGNNGSGKSSLIEGLETFQSIVVDGLDEAMNKWRGFENIRNASKVSEALRKNFFASGRDTRSEESISAEYPVRFDFDCRALKASMTIGTAEASDNLAILHERMFVKAGHYQKDGRRQVAWESNIVTRNAEGYETNQDREKMSLEPIKLPTDLSIFISNGGYFPQSWQFLELDPKKMQEPRAIKRTGQTFRLDKEGSNIADFVNDILQQDKSCFEGIIETLKYVLPYANNIQTRLTSELGKQRYLQLSEQNFEVPGWLLSTGTLRVLALLAVLRHPNPPPLLFIEEIENGLDPRTLNLLVEEIQRVTQSGKTQVVCTTHSPYFLDLLPLSSIIVVERDETGQPTFTRPDEAAMGEWAKGFAPGQLYTMSQLTKN